MKKIKLLNLFSGIGGNTYTLNRDRFEVTHIEHNVEVAEECELQNPQDIVIMDDAWEYVHDYDKYDYLWASPPCQTHTGLNNALHGQGRRRLPDFRLYALITYLKHFVKTPWVVENVKPYYQDLAMIRPTAVLSRHWYWSNYNLIGERYKQNPFNVTNARPKKDGKRMTSKEHRDKLQEYLGITLTKLRYIDGKNPSQILSNCVHPDEGKYLIEQAFTRVKGWEEFF